MITTIDVANILVRDCGIFGIEINQKGNIQKGELKNDRITIHVKKNSTGQIWNKGFVDINFSTPDKQGIANLIRLQEFEHMAIESLESVGEYNNSHYRYSIYSHGLEEDSSMKCHYINVRLLFEVLNVK